MKPNKDKVRVSIYCRVGRREHGVTESAGIADQKALLTEYVTSQDWSLVKVYADDGYSGLNVNRPAFQAMLQDIDGGEMDCVITRDLARLSRDYSESMLYLERLFPERKVRFMTLDGIDTLNRDTSGIMPLSDLLNERYRNRKVKGRKSNQGGNRANKRKGYRPTR